LTLHVKKEPIQHIIEVRDKGETLFVSCALLSHFSITPKFTRGGKIFWFESNCKRYEKCLFSAL